VPLVDELSKGTDRLYSRFVRPGDLILDAAFHFGELIALPRRLETPPN
jgi:hypothetical protein